MTTRTKVFHEMLREARGDMSKAAAARELKVRWMTYDEWEKGSWIPDDGTYAERLADFMRITEQEVVWLLHLAKTRVSADREKSPLGLTTQSDPIRAIAA